MRTIKCVSNGVWLGLEHYNLKHPHKHKIWLNHLEVKSVSYAIKCWVKIVFPSTESALRAVQLSTCVWWRAARLMPTTTWASTAGTWLEGQRLLQRLEALSWTFRVSRRENESFSNTTCAKTESLGKMMEVGSGVMDTLQTAVLLGESSWWKMGCCSLVQTKQTVLMFMIYLVLLILIVIGFYPFSAVKHRWWEEQGNCWLCTWFWLDLKFVKRSHWHSSLSEI